jgi:hypothetical protein
MRATLLPGHAQGRDQAQCSRIHLNETGDNLPAALGPFYQEVIQGIRVIDIENDPISEAVRQHGYFVATDRISD